MRGVPDPALAGRDVPRVPIIMLTARTSEDDRVSGLDLGADDYVTKPFSLRELSARVRARAPPRQRPERTAAGSAIAANICSPISTRWRLRVDGDPIRLTRREFELLRYLVQNKNRVVSRDRLARAGLGLRPPGGDPLGRRPRRPAPRQAGEAGRQIETVVGLGYRFVD